MENPLLEPLLHLLRQGGPHKLHELMSQLRTGGYLPQWPVAAEQQLFRVKVARFHPSTFEESTHGFVQLYQRSR